MTSTIRSCDSWHKHLVCTRAHETLQLNKVSGFTLVELLVSTAIVSIILGGLLAFPQIIGRGSEGSRLQNESQAAIDTDLANMRTIANNFTCSSGECKIPANTSCDNGNPCPGIEAFYQPATSEAADKFQEACTKGALADSLKSALVETSPTKGIKKREVEVVDENSKLAHRVRVTYTAPGNVERVAILVPTAAAFCPDPDT
jgi:prepilin-type N-terminal cleavage/methylation domain-containing protein